MQSRSEGLQKALKVAEAAMDKNGLDPVLLDLVEQHSYTDYLLVVSARSDRQVRAILDHVVEVMAEEGSRPLGVEGRREGRWGLIDFGDVVVHVFQAELRGHYNLESLWIDAPKVPLQVPASLMGVRSGALTEPEDELGYSLRD